MAWPDGFDLCWEDFHSILEPVSPKEEQRLLLSLVAEVVTNRPISTSVVQALLKMTVPLSLTKPREMSMGNSWCL